ncbi:MAG: SRPBCC family protein [Acidimicrobiales bacterium]
MRGSVRREVVIAAGADDAWRLVGRPELLHTWFPGVVDCRVEGDRRTVTLATGLTFDETILTNDPLQRRFQYRISGGLFAEHLASLDVVALGEHRCLVTYATDADPATLAIVLGGAMGGALDELRRQLEGAAAPAASGAAAPTPRAATLAAPGGDR